MIPRAPRAAVAARTPIERLSLLVLLLLLGGLLSACGLGQEADEPAAAATAEVPAAVAEPTAATDVEVVVPTDALAGAEATAMPMSEEPMELALSELIANPTQYLGQQVIVTGDLREVLGPRSFALNDPDEPGVNSTLVIGGEDGVIPSDFAPNIAVTEQVRVIGTVREFERGAIEEELGYQFPGTWADDLAGTPAIIADEVELLGAAQGGMDMGASIPEAARGDFPFVSVGQIDVNPEEYLGQRVTAWGEVDEQLGPNSFRVDEGNILDIAGELLVVVPEGAPRPDTLENETNIAITGVVQQFVAADFERDYGVLFDDPGIEAEFETRPVLIADIVYSRASVSDVDDDAEAYLGNRVTVLGDVTEQLDERTFRLDDPALLGGDDILVFLRDPAMMAAVGDEILVTGEVREFNRDDMADEFGYAWDDAVFDGFAENTIIVAENIQVTSAVDTAAGVAEGVLGGDRFAEDQIGISDIADDPEAYLGQQVSVNGEVSEVLGPNVIRMDEDNWLDIGDDLLVVLPEGVARPATLEDETNIVIEGTVRNFVLAEFERDYDFFSEPELYAEFENRPVIVADMLWLQASLSDVDDNPDAYLGNRVTVYGEASELVGATGFRLEDPGFFAGDDVLVLMREEGMTVAEDGRYYVTGTVQRFSLADAEAELGYDLDDALFGDWADRTVIIADRVQARGQ